MDAYERLASLIRQLQGALGGQNVRAGRVTVTFTASTTSNSVVVQHGVGRLPRVTFGATGSAGLNAKPSITAIDATSFTVQAKYDSSVSGDVGFDWHAIG